jgi:hypothetical protein
VSRPTIRQVGGEHRVHVIQDRANAGAVDAALSEE